MKIQTKIIVFLLLSPPAIGLADIHAQTYDQISFLNKYDTQKYDRKVHDKYNSKKSKHDLKYDKVKHNTYNGRLSPKKRKYKSGKHNKYNTLKRVQFKKHTKKHTKKYYTKYKKYAK